ncbi:hypothetical protein LZ30DRAFT_139148 [Colletotrichum cereale]|nr:hypothetical protein LZ30DRAFT_139148 [Colletotrichum cereale]
MTAGPSLLVLRWNFYRNTRAPAFGIMRLVLSRPAKHEQQHHSLGLPYKRRRTDTAFTNRQRKFNPYRIPAEHPCRTIQEPESGSDTSENSYRSNRHEDRHATQQKKNKKSMAHSTAFVRKAHIPERNDGSEHLSQRQSSSSPHHAPRHHSNSATHASPARLFAQDRLTGTQNAR